MPAAFPSLDDVRRALARHTPRRTPQYGRPSSVLVPLFEREGRLHVLLTKRTETLPSHAGQISFPGGKRDPSDPDERYTALREAQEEVGLDPAKVELIGGLDDCPTFVTNFVITPVVGIIPDGYPYTPNAAEIATLIEAPLADFLRPGALRVEHAARGGVTYEIFFYDVLGHVVWGATARILHQFFGLLTAGR